MERGFGLCESPFDCLASDKEENSDHRMGRGSQDDIAGLRYLGLELADVDDKLINVCARQLFRTGFVHGDPHPGNVHVRAGRDGKAEIILLDHGLYQEFTPSHRISLCRLWKSIVLRDECGMKKYSNELDARDWYLFCEILFQRPLKRSSFQLPLKMSKQDVVYMQQMASENFDRIMTALKSMPRSMLLVFRNLNTIRAITRDHGNPTDRYTLMGREASSSVAAAEAAFPVIGRLMACLSKLHFEFVLGKERFMMWATMKYFEVLHYFGRIEDYDTVKDILSQQE